MNGMDTRGFKTRRLGYRQALWKLVYLIYHGRDGISLRAKLPCDGN